MEISPIPAIRTMTVVKIPTGESQPLAVLDVDPSARPGDGGDEEGGRKSASAEAEEAESPAPEAEPEGNPEPSDDSPLKQVDYFA